MKLKNITILLIAFITTINCNRDDEIIVNTDDIYSVQNGKIHLNNTPITINGVNCLQTFGLLNTELFTDWNIKISREFIGNLKEQPIDGSPMLSSTNQWLHPLKNIVENNRSKGLVTILCPFGWVTNQQQILFTGLNPSNQLFYEEYKYKMKNIASFFAGQTDVWIQLWNEPYHFNNENNYSHNLWLNDQIEMIENLRTTEGFTNIIVIPGNEQGQSENAILENGDILLNQFNNIIFDIHAYEKWLLLPEEEINAKIQNLNNNNIPFIFGEIGVYNVTELMNPILFLNIAKQKNCNVLAWVFANNTELNALINQNNQPNNSNNNHWGNIFYNYLQ